LKQPRLLLMLLDATCLLLCSTLSFGMFFLIYTKSYAYDDLKLTTIWVVAFASLWGAIWCFAHLRRANRNFLNAARMQILDNPDDILMSWSCDGHNYVIAHQGLVVDNHYHAFYEIYEYLRSMHWKSETTLVVVISTFAGRYRVTRSIELTIPSALRSQAEQVLKTLGQST